MNPWLTTTSNRATTLEPIKSAFFAPTSKQFQRQVGGSLQLQVLSHTSGSLSWFLAQASVLGAVLILAASALPVRGQSSVTLAWDPSLGSGIAGYHLYEGAASRNYTNVIDVGESTTATASNLVSGTTYYFAVTAYDTGGLESDF